MVHEIPYAGLFILLFVLCYKKKQMGERHLLIRRNHMEKIKENKSWRDMKK